VGVKLVKHFVTVNVNVYMVWQSRFWVCVIFCK